MSIRPYAVGLIVALVAAPATAQDAINPEGLGGPPGRPYSPYADRAFPTHVYFGDTHVHTGLSADAGGGGTVLMPRDAYRFARGEQVTSNTGQPVKLSRPFDFYMITDHSDGMGADYRHQKRRAEHPGRSAGQGLSRTIRAGWRDRAACGAGAD